MLHAKLETKPVWLQKTLFHTLSFNKNITVTMAKMICPAHA